MADTVTSKTLEELFSAMPTGSLDKAILNNLRGINHRQIAGMLPMNNNMPGYTFFTRPQLNMQRDNLRNVRQLSALLTKVPTSMQTYIRCLLDPRLMSGVTIGKHNLPMTSCPIFDNQMAFIPVFTNNLTSISGWPSISVPTFSSKPGLYNESFAMVDGRVINNEVFDISVNFRNTRGNAVLYTLYVWVLYMSMVFEGKLVPYLDFITENELDYNTRIYRLVMDYKKQKVEAITACHASFPTGVPTGDMFDIQGDKPYSEANHEISARFKCCGVDYFDDILIKEFNETVGIFNPSMKDDKRATAAVRISPKLIQYFNHKGYPYINPVTRDLEWYTSIADYSAKSTEILNDITETNSEEYTGG